MADEQVKSTAPVSFKEDVKTQELPAIQESLKKLASVEGFDFLEGLIDNISYLNPKSKARMDWLMEPEQKEIRDALKKKMVIWGDLLANSDSVADMHTKSKERAEISENLLKRNLKIVLDTTRELEESYRSLHFFYKNTESTRLTNISIMNASIGQLTDNDDPKFRNAIHKELRSKYDKLDLRSNYSMLVIPGFLKNSVTLDNWAKIAYENKVMLVTDFRNVDNPQDAESMFNLGNFTSADPYKANVLMTCNYIVGRGKNTEVGEDQDLYVPGSAALAGKMYCTKLSQPVAGKEYGALDDVEAVRFDQQLTDTSNLDKAGVVPFVKAWGKIMPFSDKTLFNGDNIGMQTYSVVRVFDFIGKVLSDFLNRRAFGLWNQRMEGNLRNQIVKFLDGIQGPDKLIESFKIIRFERNEDKKNQIFLDIQIIPFFPAKSFLVKLDGYKGEDNTEEWKATFEQKKEKK